MAFNFLENDPSLESQWRAIILFGKNSATYKFAFGKALLELKLKEKSDISIGELAPIYVKSILEHLKENEKQGNSSTSTFLNACRKFNVSEINRSIAKQFKGLFTTESKRQVLIRNYNIPINQNQINQVHLGKLKRDILIQMGILTI